MRSYLSLTKVLLKNSSGGMIDGKTKSRKATYLILGFFILIGFAPFPFILYDLYNTLIQQVVAIGQEGSILAITFCMSTSITFFFSLFLVPSIFYYSKDIQTLLYLPLKPETILGAKFTICILFEYLFEALIIFPAIGAYINNGLMTPLFIIFFIIVFLTLPILPLAYSSLISMLIMRFIPFFKDRDKFNLLSGLFGILFGVGISMAIQTIQFDDPQHLITMIVSGQNSLIRLFSYFFPTISPAAFACVDGDILQFLLYIGITVFTIVALLMIAKAFYFKGAIGVSESKSSHRKTDDKLLQKQSAKKNILYSYMMKEIRILFRTPVYFLNCVSILVLLPAIMIVTMVANGGSSIFAMAEHIPWSNDWLFLVILIGVALGLLYSNINSISCTAISREGSNYVFMKYIPLSYATQIYAKVCTGIAFSEFGILFVLLPAIVVLKIPFLFSIILIVTSLLANIAGNLVGIIIDIVHPKLIWEQETAAVKQNINSVIAILACMAIPFAMIFVLFKIDADYWSYYSVITLLIVIASIPALYFFTGKLAEKQFKNL